MSNPLVLDKSLQVKLQVLLFEDLTRHLFPRYIKANDGIDTEASYPYKARNGRCHYNPADVGATDTGEWCLPKTPEDSRVDEDYSRTKGQDPVQTSRRTHLKQKLFKAASFDPIEIDTTKARHLNQV